MFDEEAPTISLDESDAFSVIRTAPVEVGFDTTPVDAIQFDDTAVVVIDQLHQPDAPEKQTTDRMIVRAGTDGEWPPDPRPPGSRRTRHAGMYKAITSITKVTKLKG